MVLAGGAILHRPPSLKGAECGFHSSRKPRRSPEDDLPSRFRMIDGCTAPAVSSRPPTFGKREWRSSRLPKDQRAVATFPFFIRSALDAIGNGMTTSAPTAPMWTQDQAIAYEAALEAINDVIAGYSEQIALEQQSGAPNTGRIAWLEMRTDQATAIMESLNVTDTENVRQVLSEYSAIVRARDAAEAVRIAA